MLKGRLALLAMAALSAGAGLPSLGRERPEYKQTDADFERIAKAEEKRQRKMKRNRK